MNSNKLVRVALLLLVLFNLVTGITLYVSKRKAAAIEAENIVLEPGATPINRATMVQQLNFSGEQLDHFTVASRNFRRVANHILRDLNIAKIDLSIALYQNEPDSLEANNIAKEIGGLHTKLKEETILFYMELNSLCNAEQRRELQLLFEPLFRDGPQHQGGYGRGRGYGRGTGRGRGPGVPFDTTLNR